MGKVSYYTVATLIEGECAGLVTATYLTDALGSVTVAVAGVAVEQSVYKPYGQGTMPTIASLGWLGARGYRRGPVPEVDVYIRARTYSTIRSRWTSRDPVWPRQASYTYAFAKPTRRSDSKGTFPDSGGLPSILPISLPPTFPPFVVPKPSCRYDCENWPGGPCQYAAEVSPLKPSKGQYILGRTVCCNGRAYACSDTASIERNFPGTRVDDVAKCVLKHEVVHVNSTQPACKHKGFDDKGSSTPEECLGFEAFLRCITSTYCHFVAPPEWMERCYREEEEITCKVCRESVSPYKCSWPESCKKWGCPH